MENVQELKLELERVKKERDAVVADINALLSTADGIICYYCKHFNKNSRGCNFSSEISEGGCRGEWRGYVEES